MQCKEIEARQSVRLFQKNKEIPKEVLEDILLAAAAAPSGRNLQPWRFRVIDKKEEISSISENMKMNHWIRNSSCIIAVGLAREAGYDIVKDAMGIGAAIENMLLEATSNQVDSCWVCGEVGEEVANMLGTGESIKLMALVALGYARGKGAKVKKKTIDELLF